MYKEDMQNHLHCGDGVYAQWDGHGFWLRANHHTDECCTDKIYIEPSVLQNLNVFYEHMLKARNPNE